MEGNDEPEDVRFADSFKPLCELSGHAVEPNQTFTTAWLAHAREQKPLAAEAARRFLDRYEIKSLWETQEIQDELNGMWELAQIGNNSFGADGEDANQEEHEDPDEGKPRVTVRQYAALIGQEVMANLEGLARARREKHPRAYQTDVEIHQSYISATSGGADGPIDGPEDGPIANAAPSASREVFPLVRWDYNQEEMRSILDFEHKRRPTPLLKELLNLPCMQQQYETTERTEDTDRRRVEHILLQSKYKGLEEASVQEKLELKRIQGEALETNADESHIEQKKPTRRLHGKQGATASFAKDGLYDKPSAFIRYLIAELPQEEKLTRRQTLFVVKFAEACDEA